MRGRRTRSGGTARRAYWCIPDPRGGSLSIDVSALREPSPRETERRSQAARLLVVDVAAVAEVGHVEAVHELQRLGGVVPDGMLRIPRHVHGGAGAGLHFLVAHRE